MTEQTKKSLLTKAERIAEESGDTMLATMFLNGADCYRNSVWHDAEEPPVYGDSMLTAIIIKTRDKRSVFPYYLVKGTPWTDLVSHKGIDKWAYPEDLLPDEDV